ncbi:hypothetical protein [Pseudomonas entomophila]|uniref:hypothetical protein n=1 Tax=Pseudomonas entomophila TaxID=312306 RepID=UPI001F013F11|nr:hypothetical protein [Pseudomonas entomophila]MCG8291419.1 hypothetical protein [Pseudomonas entomophila]
MNPISHAVLARVAEQVVETGQHEFNLVARGKHGFNHTYHVRVSPNEDHSVEVFRDYFFGKGSGGGKTSEQLTKYIEYELNARYKALKRFELAQSIPGEACGNEALHNPCAQAEEYFDKLFPPLPTPQDDEPRAVRDARYLRQEGRDSFLKFTADPARSAMDERLVNSAMARLTAGVVKSDFQREGDKKLIVLLNSLSSLGYDISDPALQDAIFSIHSGYHSAGYCSINTIYQTLLR